MNTVMKLICLALVASALAHTTSGFASVDRSIKHCTVSNDGMYDTCVNVCQAQLPKTKQVPPLLVELEIIAEGQQCCCKFDDLWTIDEEKYQDVSSILRRELMIQPIVCEKLIMSLSSKQEKSAYKTMCKHLSSTTPLTMLELSEFLQSVSYLKSNPPKSERIKRVVDRDYVPNITQQMYSLFYQKLEYFLFDRKREEPNEPPFEVDQIKELTKETTELRKTLNFDIAHRAFDELIISRVISSLVDAEQFYKEINKTIPLGSFVALYGLAAPVDPLEVEVVDFSCDKFINYRDILSDLLGACKSAFDSLKLSHVYNHVSVSWTLMKNLQNSNKVYNTLISARCADGGKMVTANEPIG